MTVGAEHVTVEHQGAIFLWFNGVDTLADCASIVILLSTVGALNSAVGKQGAVSRWFNCVETFAKQATLAVFLLTVSAVDCARWLQWTDRCNVVVALTDGATVAVFLLTVGTIDRASYSTLRTGTLLPGLVHALACAATPRVILILTAWTWDALHEWTFTSFRNRRH